jgi:anti-sigma regulatory factor (Ser/Thr protein kinase)
VPTQAYEAQTMPFPTGSTLLLYTDGLIERRQEPIDESMERLAHAAGLAAQSDEMTFADRVYKRLIPDTPLADDVALLAIESLPFGDRMELSVEATPRVLAGLRRAIARWLIKLGVPERERFDIVLAASEAAGNAIEHAYGLEEATFAVDCEWSGGEVRIRVTDSGAWRPARRDERGRGLMLMREFMDTVNVERGDSGTLVTLVKRVPGTP